MDGTEVNSISDTPESLQIATIIKTKYYDIVSRGTLPENRQMFSLNPSDDPDKPILMYVPEGVSEIEWIKYYDTSVDDSSTSTGFSHDLNVDITATPVSDTSPAPNYKYVTMLPVDQFVDMINSYSLQDSDVESFIFTEPPDNFIFYYRNDRQPRYCTIISNYYVIFDAYDAVQDSTLQTSKIMCYGYITPPFQMQDSFIPDMSDDQFPLLFNEAKALAFYELKQMPHAKAEQEIKRGWSSLQKTKSISDKPSYFDQLPSFGRQPRTGGYGTIWPRINSMNN
jgi:hypothetical protein